MQSQVNPHFLYNTLDMIYWMLDEEGNEQLGELVLSLSSMFRYSSQWEDGAEVSLREEPGADRALPEDYLDPSGGPPRNRDGYR